MEQNFQSTSLGPKRLVELRNYFLPLPSRNVFSWIMLSAFLVVLVIPLIIINSDLLVTANLLTEENKSKFIAIAIFILILPLCISCARLILYYLRLRPTDQEYDTWVRDHLSELSQMGLSQLSLHPSEIVEQPLCIPGVVWPNSQEADFYLNNGYPIIKWDKDGQFHASINRFIFFYPTLHTLAMFTCDVNALSNVIYRRAQKFFYKDIVGFEIVDLKASGYPSDALQRFEIHIANGATIGIPLSPLDSNVMGVVRLLNALLREHQNG